ncbi:MAG: hypothetical protein NVSMB23_01480 [Myxococcales bacterium]
MSERKGEPRDPLAPEPEYPELRGGSFVPDIVRRAVLTGVGALFMTEEGIRKSVGDLKLPKDALAFVLGQADRTRAEVARVVTQEVRRFLESETLRREIGKLFTGLTLEVNATLQLKPTGETGFKTRIRRKRSAGPGRQGGASAGAEPRARRPRSSDDLGDDE